MKRFFGRGKQEPPPDFNTAIQNVEARGESVEKKIAKLDADLKKLKDQLNAMREGPSKSLIKQRAARILKQKRIYESQREQLDQQVFNMDQSNFALQSMKENQVTFAAMKDGLKTMRREYKKINIEKIDDLQDQMEDMLEMNSEIQEAMSCQYDTPFIDEAELEAELAELGDELDLGVVDTSYIDEALSAPGVPIFKPRSNVLENGLELDEYGLPKVPTAEFD